MDDLTLLRALLDTLPRPAPRPLPEEAAAPDMVDAYAQRVMQAAETFLRQQDVPLLLLGPAVAPLRIGRGAPGMRIVIEPVEGARNLLMGPPFDSFATLGMATLPPAGPMSASTVRTALLQPLNDASAPCMMQAGRAWTEHGGRRHALEVVPREKIEDVVLGVALEDMQPGMGLSELMGKAGGVRVPGGTSAGLMAVARGQLGAFLDARCQLSACQWLAGAALVRAAGGVVMLLDEALEQAAPPVNLLQPRALVAAANRALLEDILAHLRRAWL